MVSPASVMVVLTPKAVVGAAAVFTNAIDGDEASGVDVGSSLPLPAPAVISSERSVTAGPAGGVPEAVAWLSTLARFKSTRVMMYGVALEQLVTAPGTSVVDAQTMPGIFASVTDTGFRVTLPVLVIANV